MTNEATRDLCRAVEAKDLAGIDDALDRGADIDAWGGEGARQNALQKAATLGFEAGFERLLDRGADIHAQPGGQYSATALLVLKHRASPHLVSRALAAGVNPDWRDRSGNTLLHLAASRSSVDVVKLLLQHGVDPAARAQDGKTALHMAIASHGDANLEMIVTLAAVTPGLDIPFTGPNGRGQTALQQALLAGAGGVISCLVALGARADTGRIAGDVVRSAPTEWDIERRLALSPLENAVSVDSTELVLHCLERHPDIDQAQIDAGLRLARQDGLDEACTVIQSWVARRSASSALSSLVSRDPAP